MKSNRLTIVLGYATRIEVASGVWEDEIVEKVVKAQREQIYQKRRDVAMQEGLVITDRLRIRSNLFEGTLKYVSTKGKKFKVNSVFEHTNSHEVVIELGSLM